MNRLAKQMAERWQNQVLPEAACLSDCTVTEVCIPDGNRVEVPVYVVGPPLAGGIRIVMATYCVGNAQEPLHLVPAEDRWPNTEGGLYTVCPAPLSKMYTLISCVLQVPVQADRLWDLRRSRNSTITEISCQLIPFRANSIELPQTIRDDSPVQADLPTITGGPIQWDTDQWI